DRQRHRRDEAAVAVEHVLDLGVDEADRHLDERLELRGHPGRGAAGHHPEGAHRQHADEHRDQQAVDVDGPERAVADRPLPVLEVMGDVFAGAFAGSAEEITDHRSNQGKPIMETRRATSAPPSTNPAGRPAPPIARTSPAPTTSHLSPVPTSRRMNMRPAGATGARPAVRQAKTADPAATTVAPIRKAAAGEPPATVASTPAPVSPATPWAIGSRRAARRAGSDRDVPGSSCCKAEKL